MIWAAEIDFDPGSVGLVLAPDFSSEADYFREYETYVDAVRTAREAVSRAHPRRG